MKKEGEKDLFIELLELRAVSLVGNHCAVQAHETWIECESAETLPAFIKRIGDLGDFTEIILARGSTVDHDGQIDEGLYLHIAQGDTFAPIRLERFLRESCAEYNVMIPADA